jgi:GNAT superfamily N-acetyltransferase
MGQASTPPGLIRLLTPEDLTLFREHLRRLDEDARRDRFAMGATDAFIDRYAQCAVALDTTQIGYFACGELRAVAELRLVGRREAEMAFTVEPACRRQGIGTALFRELIEAARQHRVRRLYGSCLARNRAMQALARKFEAELVFEAADVLGIVERGRDAETVFATAILDLPPRWLGLLSRRS